LPAIALSHATYMGHWAVHKSTGRPYREMLSLLAGAFALIGFLALGFFLFRKWVFAPDPRTRHLSDRLLSWAICLLLLWFGGSSTGWPNRGASSISGRIPTDLIPA
jgi:hypothetical protein